MIKIFRHESAEIICTITDSNSQDQLHWVDGRFDDLPMLKVMGRACTKKGAIIDIGAGNGNHTMYFSKVMEKRVISFEKSRKKYELLRKNVINNDINGFIGDFRISDTRSKGTNVLSLLVFEPVAMIRINSKEDCFKILSGAKKLIREYSPDLFIKVPKQGINEVLEILNTFFKCKYEYVEHLELGYIHDLKHFKAV